MDRSPPRKVYGNNRKLKVQACVNLLEKEDSNVGKSKIKMFGFDGGKSKGRKSLTKNLHPPKEHLWPPMKQQFNPSNNLKEKNERIPRHSQKSVGDCRVGHDNQPRKNPDTVVECFPVQSKPSSQKVVMWKRKNAVCNNYFMEREYCSEFVAAVGKSFMEVTSECFQLKQGIRASLISQLQDYSKSKLEQRRDNHVPNNFAVSSNFKRISRLSHTIGVSQELVTKHHFNPGETNSVESMHSTELTFQTASCYESKFSKRGPCSDLFHTNSSLSAAQDRHIQMLWSRKRLDDQEPTLDKWNHSNLMSNNNVTSVCSIDPAMCHQNFSDQVMNPPPKYDVLIPQYTSYLAANSKRHPTYRLDDSVYHQKQ